MRIYLRCLSIFREDLLENILALVLIAVSTVVGLLQPFPLAIMLDSVLGDAKDMDNWVYRLFIRFAPHNNPVRQIIALTVFMLILRLLAEIFRMLQTFVSIRIGYAGMMRMRCELFRKIQQLSIGYHRSQPQGDAIYRVAYDTWSVQQLLGVMQGMLVHSVTLVAMAWISFTIEWRLTLVALAVVPPLMFVIKWYGRVLKSRSKAAKEVDSALTTVVQRSVSAISLVQAFGREAEEYATFQSTASQSVRTWMRLHLQEVLYWLVIGSILGVGTSAIFGYGGYLVYTKQLGLGLLTVILAYVAMLYDPLNKLMGTGATLQIAVAGVQRVFEVLDREPIIRDAPNAMHLPREPRVLELEHVSFAYNPAEPVLQDITVKISPGQMVAFVGSSGVGKTTLLNLLPRFYDPTGGALKLDGHDVRTVKVKDLRKHIALVLQENIVLPASVAENIAYGRPDATQAQIAQAAEIAGAASFIDRLPQKYDTQISEAGQNLSGGQRQRISIARALLTEAPIMVLDEPTSALDPQHEQLIIETLARLKRQRTIILVSHRLSTVADCDQIFVMDGGQIVEQGTHEQLIARGGLYYKMARHQLKLPASPAETAATPADGSQG